MNIILNLKLKKGFIAIESVIVMSGILMFLLLFIGFLTYTFPKIALEKEIQVLTQTAKIQGGLTDINSQTINSDIELFKDNLEKMGYTRSEIIIQAKTIQNGLNAVGVTPINERGNNYIKRDSKELIEIVVQIPAEKNIFHAPLKYFGLNNSLSGVYTFRSIVASERW